MLKEKSKRLKKAVKETFRMLESCSICPRKCGVNRLKGQTGFCKTGLKPRVFSFLPHYGEEPPVSGSNGSGTIFFSNCNAACVYCQNYEFSQLGEGREVSFDELAGFMLQLQKMGCHNINLVTPTHIMPQILMALDTAIAQGLKIPIVYNTGGYELPEIIKLLDGIIDIYLADMRYAEKGMAQKYSFTPDYPKYNQAAVKEMHRQIGIAKINKYGIIKKGMIIRHLVLPENISGTEKIMAFIARELSCETYISLMSQYMPCYKTDNFKEISRRISGLEYEEASRIMQKYALFNGWLQESCGLERFAGTNIKPSLTADR